MGMVAKEKAKVTMTDRIGSNRPRLLRFNPMFLIVGFQIFGALFFFYDVIGPLIGIRTQPLDWRVHELIEITTIAGLLLGSFFGLAIIRRSDERRRIAEHKLASLAKEFHDLLELRFAE